ncbi:MAG: D-aminoacyl-tRNA deacylase [Candidatus Heimdallarchaeota archaeon]
MMRIIVASTADQASQTIKKCLIDQYPFKPSGDKFEGEPVLRLDKPNIDIRLITTRNKPVLANHLEQQFQPELFVFISKHRSETGRPALLTHVTGNWLNAVKVGGEPKALGVAPGYAVRIAFRTLSDQVKAHQLPFQVNLEVTHHGPTSLSVPLLFIELGSTKKEWENKQAGSVVAIAAIEAAQANPNGETVIGFGGGHYCPRFADILRKTPLSVAHIAPKYVLDQIDKMMIKKALERSATPISFAVIDHKGTLLSQREKLITFLNEINLKSKRIDHVLKEYQQG